MIKFYQVLTKSNFTAGLESGAYDEEGIAFIEDENEIYAKGHYYPCPYTKDEIDALFTSQSSDISDLEDKLQSEIDRATAAETALTASSSDLTVTVNSSSEGTDLSVNIDNETIVKSEDGVISVADEALTLYEGENAISVSEASNNVKTISLVIASTDKVLSQDENGLTVNLTIEKVTDGLDENVLEAYNIIGNGVTLGTIPVYKDRTLISVSIGTTTDTIDSSTGTVTAGDGNEALVYVHYLADGTYTLTAIDISEFLKESEFGDGLQVTSGVVSVKISDSSESYLTVDSDGLKLSGIADIIANLSASSVGGSGYYIQSISEDAGIISATAAELNATAVSSDTVTSSDTTVGITSTNVQSALEELATSIKSATSALDADEVGGSGYYIQSISETDGVITATADELIASNVGVTTVSSSTSTVGITSSDAQSALEELATAVQTEATTRESADTTLQSNIDALSDELEAHRNNEDDPGSKHLPEGGEEGDCLYWLADGEGQWMSLSEIQFDTYSYGVRWTTNQSDPSLTRLGTASMIKECPITSQFKGCVVLDGTNVQYYLHPDDWNWKADTLDTVYAAEITDSDTLTGTISFITSKNDALSELEVGDKISVNLETEGTVTDISTTTETTSSSTTYLTVVTVEWEEEPEWTDDYDGDVVYIQSRLDGYDGVVRVETPVFYGWSSDTDDLKLVRVSTIQVESDWIKIPAMYIDAYRPTVLNTVPEDMGWLSTLEANALISVKNTETYCRGWNNSSTYDVYLEGDDDHVASVFRTPLGKPRTSMSRATARTYAALNNSLLLCYEYYKWVFYWLYVCEYANFNCLLTYNAELTDAGYPQGGLGSGVTTTSENYWKMLCGSIYPIIPNGFTDELGNNTGIVATGNIEFSATSSATSSVGSYTVSTYTTTVDGSSVSTNKIAYSSITNGRKITAVYSSGTILYITGYSQCGETTYTISGMNGEGTISFYTSSTTLLSVTEDGTYTVDWGSTNSNREIRTNFTADSCAISIAITSYSTVDLDLTISSFNVPRWHGIEQPFGDVLTNLDGVVGYRTSTAGAMNFYTTTDPDYFDDTLDGKTITASSAITSSGYVKEFELGSTGNIIPESTGGGSTTYKCDYYYTSSGTTYRTLLVGGNARTGAAAGLGCLASDTAVSSSSAYLGFRSISAVL